MSEVLQANVFFFITTAAVVVFTLLLCVLLYHIIKITRAIRRMIERIEEGSEVIAEDISFLRRHLAEGSFISGIISMFLNQRSGKRRGRKQRDEDEEDE